MESYSEYDQSVEDWWRETTGEDLGDLKARARLILREDNRLQQIVRLIGEDSLPEEQKMTVLAARLIKDGFLQQNAFDPVDMYALPDKQLKMLKAILRFCDMGQVLVRKGIPAFRLRDLESFQVLRRMKSTVKNEDAEQIDTLIHELEEEMYRNFPIEEREFFTASGGAETLRASGEKE
jgi:V/A-type H+-transporting ATPase subunit A